MPKNPERGYEDSYQKRERLEGELRSAISDIRDSFSVFRKDSGEVADSFERCDAIKKRIDELTEQENNLWKKLDEQQTKLKKVNESEPDLDAKIDANATASAEIDSTREKILDIEKEMDSLFEELSKIVEEEPAQIGDYEGTMVVIKMKMQKVEEIKKQLDELED
jgi:chromosome segregation ATPase